MLFYDGDETESGGLTFGGRKAARQHQPLRHLSFDRYDQTTDPDHGCAGQRSATARPWPSSTSRAGRSRILQLLDRIKKLPPSSSSRGAGIPAKPSAGRAPRFFGRQSDNSTALQLRDPPGTSRPAGGGRRRQPSLQFLDASGGVTHHYPELPG